LQGRPLSSTQVYSAPRYFVHINKTTVLCKVVHKEKQGR